MRMFKVFFASLFMMMAVAVAVSAAPNKKVKGAFEVEYFYMGDTNDETAMKKVSLYCANRKVIDKTVYKGITQRVADEFRSKGNVVTDLEIYSQRFFKEGTQSRYVDFYMTFETHFVYTPGGSYMYIWVCKNKPEGDVQEEYKTENFYSSQEWLAEMNKLYEQYGLVEDGYCVLSTKTK